MQRSLGKDIFYVNDIFFFHKNSKFPRFYRVMDKKTHLHKLEYLYVYMFI